MDYTLVVVVALVAFMIHEFEEIILITPWIKRKSTDAHFRDHYFMVFKNKKTSTIAVLIAEEFIMFSAFSILAVLLKSYSFIWAFYCIYSFHLLGHILEFFIYRSYCPSLVTSILTLPVYLWLIFSFMSLGVLRWNVVLLCFPMLFIIIGCNFKLINWSAPRINQWIINYEKEDN